jgi:hypothetical protein
VTEARLSLLSECFFADIVQSLENLLDSFDNWLMCDEIDEIIESLTDHPTPLFPDLDILAPSDEPEDQPEEYAGQLAVSLPPWPATTSERPDNAMQQQTQVFPRSGLNSGSADERLSRPGYGRI